MSSVWALSTPQQNPVTPIKYKKSPRRQTTVGVIFLETNACPKWKFAISGLLTGFVNGFFGAGGGMVLIPLLTRLCKVEDKKAFATSVCIVLPICITSLAVYALRGGLQFSGAWPYLLGGLGGGLLGGLLFKNVSAGFLHKVLGGFILWGGLRLVLG